VLRRHKIISGYLAMDLSLRRHAHRWAMPGIAAIAVLAGAVATSVAADGKPATKHVMTFDRRPAVGQAYKFTCSYKRTQTVTFAGPEKRETCKWLHVANCEGILTPLEVGKDGKSTKISFT
jgi:hypothetical protein